MDTGRTGQDWMGYPHRAQASGRQAVELRRGTWEEEMSLDFQFRKFSPILGFPISNLGELHPPPSRDRAAKCISAWPMLESK
mmetsp:Transcript_19580/g.29293  ORF Transcript_19580/g.29293 Transcript_19580/m.29293 type:complete len:82 (-) Transcript_19580:78-323(-)